MRSVLAQYVTELHLCMLTTRHLFSGAEEDSVHIFFKPTEKINITSKQREPVTTYRIGILDKALEATGVQPTRAALVLVY